ncbi:SET domain-containing protein 4-like [Dendronephthya gigantea]|uniref:SET domain-containing protein 4-like n=1 Tax=Dendronephthya gigantea TaxID=151771 RepID=UPI00106DA0F7|nr:SET domain-containing protein 4-like [Dendronephthya gigantea]XP_028406088.1 SET domain-containing protein 4-like [Dendronephthya gigantea]XP_028406089.1 SET domain-containing protein 4-like [Dendronephthya gigantea]
MSRQTKGRTWRQRQKRRLKGAKIISLSQKPEYIELFQWAKENGVVFHKMRPAIFPGTGRGLMATRQINDGDLLISVPRRLLITGDVLRNYYTDGISQVKRPNLTTIDLLCLFLIVEKSLGNKSFWSPYVTMLPSQYNTPAYFNHHELSHAPKFFMEHGQAQLKSIRECYLSLKQFISDEMKKNSVELSFNDVRWAWNAVNTRCVYLCGESKFGLSNQGEMACCLAPLLDLLNHSSDVQIQAGYFGEKQCYEIYAKTRVKKGGQVFINYGPHSNRKLLIEYGFILANNCHSSVKIESTLVYDTAAKFNRCLSKRMCDVVSKYNLEATFFCSLNGLSWSLETVLKLLCLEDDSKIDLKSLCIESLEVSDENRVLMHILSREILKSILDNYQKDIARILSENSNGLSDRMRQLEALLKGEMNVVKNALLSLDLKI